MPPSHPSKHATINSGNWSGRQPGLDCESWKKYFLRFFREEPEGSYFNGQLVANPGHKRNVHRWRHEQNVVGFYTATDFLMHFGLTIDDFFIFCRDNDLPTWYAKDAKTVRRYTRELGG